MSSGTYQKIFCSICLLLIFCGLFLAEQISIHRFYQIDEFVFVRNAWLLTQGELPYRDFFEHHTPLFYVLLAPVIALSPENTIALVLSRTFSFLIMVGVLLNGWFLAKRMTSTACATFAVAMLLFVPGFVTRAIEIRPDSLALLFFLMSANLILFAKQSSKTKTVFKINSEKTAVLGSGIFLSCCLLCTQKALYYCCGIILLSLVDLTFCHFKKCKPFFFKSGAMTFIIGALIPMLMFLIYLILTHSFFQFKEQNFDLAIKWQTQTEPFSVKVFLLPIAKQSWLWFSLGVFGLIIFCVNFFKNLKPSTTDRTIVLHQNIIYLAILVPVIFSVFINPIPWPYNFLQLFAAMIPLIAMCCYFLFQNSNQTFALSISLLLLLIIMLPGAKGLRAETEIKNTSQYDSLRDVLEATDENDAVFDNNGSYIFRPATYHYWYHSVSMRELMTLDFAREMIPAIIETDTTVWVRDQRFNQLPPNVRSFTFKHFKKYSGPIYLWGQSYKTENPQGNQTHEFLANKTGNYFLQVKNALLENAEIKINGETYKPNTPIHLEKGTHTFTVAFTTDQNPIYWRILWLPANGKFWKPKKTGDKYFYPKIF